MQYIIGEYYCPFCGFKLHEKIRRISGEHIDGMQSHDCDVTIYYYCSSCNTKIEHTEKLWEAAIMETVE